jgi:hypothetical protein
MHRQTIRNLCILSLFVVTANSVSKVEAEEWSWNPFKKSSSSRDSSPLYSSSKTTSSKSSWMPSWTPSMTMPWSKSKPKVNSYSKPKTSTFNQLSKTSKKWWNKTAELLDPYPDPKPSKYESLASSEKKKPNWFTGMFKKEEPEKIQTLPDWLRQETPKF